MAKPDPAWAAAELERYHSQFPHMDQSISEEGKVARCTSLDAFEPGAIPHRCDLDLGHDQDHTCHNILMDGKGRLIQQRMCWAVGNVYEPRGRSAS